MKLFKGGLIFLAIAFAILTYFVKQTTYHAGTSSAYHAGTSSAFSLDLAITLAIQKFDPPWFDLIMIFISDVGYLPESLLIIGGFFIILITLSKRLEAFLFLLCAFGAMLLGEVVKILINRSRPSPELVNQFVAHTRQDSFPSGHVLLFMGIFGLLIYLSFTLSRNKVQKFILCSLLLLPIILIGLSRIYLGEHWFSDVLGAYLLGILWLAFIIFCHHRLKK